MSEILDQFDDEDKTAKKDKRVFIYSLIMLIGGVFFLKYTTVSASKASIRLLFAASLLFQLMVISSSSIISLISLMIKGKLKEKVFTKIFWIDQVEIGFGIWCLLVVIVFADKFLL